MKKLNQFLIITILLFSYSVQAELVSNDSSQEDGCPPYGEPNTKERNIWMHCAHPEFFVGERDARISKSITRVSRDEVNKVIRHPCPAKHGVPFRRYYAFTISEFGQIFKLERNQNPRQHLGEFYYSVQDFIDVNITPYCSE